MVTLRAMSRAWVRLRRPARPREIILKSNDTRPDYVQADSLRRMVPLRLLPNLPNTALAFSVIPRTCLYVVSS